jgi:hypothetical protein
MQPVGIELKSPLSPFFKGGFFSAGFQPLPSMNSGQAFWKRGPRGDFREIHAGICSKLLTQDTQVYETRLRTGHTLVHVEEKITQPSF